MSVEISCPSCGAKLFPVELAEGQCTSCMTRLPAGFASQPRSHSRPLSHATGAASRHNDENHISGGYYSRYQGTGHWGTMRVGLKLLLAGDIVFLLCIAPLLLGVVAGAAARSPELFILGLAATGILILVGGLLLLIGLCLVCTIPPESGGRGWALGGLVCLILPFFGCLGLALVMAALGGASGGRSPPREADAISALGGIGFLAVWFMGTLCWTMTFRAAARYWQDNGLGTSFVVCFILHWVLQAVSTAVQVFMTATRRVGSWEVGGGEAPRVAEAASAVTLLLNCGLGLVGLVLVIWYLTLLYRLIDRIPKTG